MREIVSAQASDVKFIVTDHPVTAYNAACPPGSKICQYPDDPPISLNGTQTIFALDADHCLILTNLEYAQAPEATDPLKDRQNARYTGQTLARTDKMIRTRGLTRDEVIAINHVLKSRARRYVAASDESWLHPENGVTAWQAVSEILLPPKKGLWDFGGETYVGHYDGSVQYQDAFGRTSHSHEYLRKEQRETVGANESCGCGSGRRYKKCCGPLAPSDRPQWSHYSIRDRNIILINAVDDILGLNKGKTWTDVRRELSDDQVKRIHEVFQGVWPRDTSIVELLPRTDDRVWRATYMGLVDPRTIEASVSGWLAYFDEIVVVHPFMNPNYIRPEYSPIESPGQHKSQTLKNIMVLLRLEPFIRAGVVHLIPDPGDLNLEYQQTALRMARQRGTLWEPAKEDMRLGTWLARDDYKRATLRMGESFLRGMIRDSNPDISADQLERTVKFAKSELDGDPLALLQPIDSGPSGGELLVQRGVSLETALFLAQMTGATVYTDSHAHWVQLNEHTRAANKSGTSCTWPELLGAAAESEYITELNPETILQLRQAGELGYVRRCFSRIWKSLQHEKTDAQSMSKVLADRLRLAAVRMTKDWQACAGTVAPSERVRWRMELSIPQEGFGAATVHRLLVTFGRATNLRAIPMAIFVKAIGHDEREVPH